MSKGREQNPSQVLKLCLKLGPEATLGVLYISTGFVLVLFLMKPSVLHSQEILVREIGRNMLLKHLEETGDIKKENELAKNQRPSESKSQSW